MGIHPAERRGGSPGRWTRWMVALGHARPGRAEHTEDGRLQGSPMAMRPHEPARRPPVDGDEGIRARDDLDRRGAEPVTDGEDGADEAGWDAVAGASEGDANAARPATPAGNHRGPIP